MYTPITLEKTRNLRYGMVALSLIEDSFGYSIDKLDMKNLTMRNVATILWAGMNHEDKEITPLKIMELIDEHSNIGDAIQTMSKALGASFGESKKKAVKATETQNSQ